MYIKYLLVIDIIIIIISPLHFSFVICDALLLCQYIDRKISCRSFQEKKGRRKKEIYAVFLGFSPVARNSFGASFLACIKH